MHNPKISGIILCGGESKRMGQNKALLNLGEKPIIEHIITNLKNVCSEIIINSNTNDLAHLPYKQVKDKFSGIGPIAGIYSTLSETRTNGNIIVSCDTPFVSASFFKYLLSESNGYDVVLPYIKGFAQSLTGYFSKSIVKFIADEINKAHYKPIQMFESLNINKLKITNEHDFYTENLFLNINSMEDYHKACKIYNRILQ